MSLSEQYACFGIQYLGPCKYDPEAPFTTYFTIGDAIAALAFTFAVQQFLKPIYTFRLQGFRVRFNYLVLAVFIGAFCAIVAAIVPGFPFIHQSILGYPVTWEIAGGIIVIGAYAIIATIALKPVCFRKRNITGLVGSGVELLSEANDADRLQFSKELFSNKNIYRIVSFASEIDRARHHAITIAFDKAKSENLEPVVRGQPDITAFYAFARRDQLELASYANFFLQTLSDPDLCRVIITSNPWSFLRSVFSLLEAQFSVDSARTFIQGVAWQALVREDGILAKEDGYEGFGFSRTFATEFFGNPRILRAFEPFGGITSVGYRTSDPGFVSRLNIASELMFDAEIREYGFWQHRSSFNVSQIYIALARQISIDRSNNVTPQYISQFSRGVGKLAERIGVALETCDPRIYDLLFAEGLDAYRNDAVGNVAELVSESLECVSSGFTGFDDHAWLLVIDLFHKVFENYGAASQGLSPFQQAVAIKLISKLSDNMDGYYPTLSRVLLAVIGPYKSPAPAKEGTALAVLRDAVYLELKRIPVLFEKAPEKVAERLPSNVTYSHTDRSLIHTYRGGKQARTALDEISSDPINLLSEAVWRRRHEEETDNSGIGRKRP